MGSHRERKRNDSDSCWYWFPVELHRRLFYVEEAALSARSARGVYEETREVHFPRFLFLSAAFLASITVTLLVLAIVFSGDHSPRLWIKSPAENNRVGLSIAVRGGSSHLGSNRYIWLFVKPSSTTQYYPQSGPVFKRPKNGDWLISPNWAMPPALLSAAPSSMFLL